MYKKLLSFALLGLITFSMGTSGVAAASEETDPSSVEFELTVDGVSKEVNLSKLGVRAEEKAEEEEGRIAALISWIGQASLFNELLTKEINYEFSWSELRSEDALRNIYDLDRPKNARFIESDGVLNIEAEVEGREFDINELLEEIIADYPRLQDYELETSEAELTTAEDLIDHFGQVQSILETGFNVTIDSESHNFPAQLKDIVVIRENGEVRVDLNAPYMEYVLDTLDELTYEESNDLLISEAPEGLGKASIEGMVKNGRNLDRELTEKLISGAIRSGEADTTGVLNIEQGEIINQSGLDLGNLDRLSMGISDFSTSPSGRDFNVRKALNEHYNGMVIPAGESFHFNDFLGPVTYSAGWAGSYAIFNGNQLKTVPGGGICQVSTTIYRAALNAGLDIEQQRNHSLYASSITSTVEIYNGIGSISIGFNKDW